MRANGPCARRVLCDAVGRDVDEGRIPADVDACATAVRDICVGNARYFSLPEALGGLTAV
jgi:glucuronate isomerase